MLDSLLFFFLSYFYIIITQVYHQQMKMNGNTNQYEKIKIDHLNITLLNKNQKKILLIEIQERFLFDNNLDDVKYTNEFSKIRKQLVQDGHVQKDQNYIMIFLISSDGNQKSNYSLINYGIKHYFEVETMLNLHTSTDLMLIEYDKKLPKQKLYSFVKQLTYGELSKVLHGCSLQLKANQKQGTDQKQETGKDQFTIITGGSRGIGKQTALQMAKDGNNLILTGTPGNKLLEKFAQQLSETYKIKVFTYFLDLKNKQSCKQFAEYINSLNVTIKTIVYNGAVGTKTSEEQTAKGSTKEEVLIEVNTIGNIYLHNTLQQCKVVNTNTLIIIVSSVGALRQFYEMNPTDGCSKRMLQAWAEQLNKRNYNRMIIYPGATDTEMLQKSTLNPLKQANQLTAFIQRLPKQIVINPHSIGYIISLVSKDQFKESLRGSKITACCGQQFDFQPMLK